jgi:hypothetical protein
LELEIARQNLKENRLNLQLGLKEDFTFVVECSAAKSSAFLRVKAFFS